MIKLDDFLSRVVQGAIVGGLVDWLLSALPTRPCGIDILASRENVNRLNNIISRKLECCLARNDRATGTGM